MIIPRKISDNPLPLLTIKIKTMEKYSDRLNRLSYSQTFVMSNKVREMRAQGVNVIGLTLGEPDFDIPDNIKQAAFDAINENFSHYSPVPGFWNFVRLFPEN